MKYTVITNKLDVIGRIWMPDCVCAMSYTLTDFDLECMRDDGVITREAMQDYIDTHCGDFQEVIDWSADIGDGDYVKDWDSEESMLTFYDCMYGSEGE